MINLAKFAAITIAVTAMAAPAMAFQNKKGDVKTPAELPAYSGPKKRVAVAAMDIPKEQLGALNNWLKTAKAESGINTIDDVGLNMTAMLTTALTESGRFTVLERQDFGDIKGEMDLTTEYGNEKTKVKKGNILGAQMIIRASVTEFTNNRNKKSGGVSLGVLSFGGNNKEAAVTLDIKFIDPNTSRILYTAKAEGRSKSKGAAFGLKLGSLGLGGGSSTEEPVEKATRDAINKAVIEIAKRMDGIAWEARVAKVDANGLIVISRGTQDGIGIGDTFKVYKPGEAITDPETGEMLGRDEDVLIGECKITWVGDKVARAKFTGSGKVVANAVIKQ